MLEIIVLLAFMMVLIASVVSGSQILCALLIGYFIFFIYGLLKGFCASDILKVSASGVYKVRNILIIFVLIGMITGLWRASGTIAVIIVYAVNLIHPSVFLVVAFLLNVMVSFLTGTSFGTAATMGIICMTMAKTMGVNPVLAGGAILSGAMFGDRCSPVSSSALLVCELTETDIYDNVKHMFRTGAVPFLLTCLIYFVLGLSVRTQWVQMDIRAIFSEEFYLHWLAALPALLILVLSMKRLPVKWTLAISAVTALVLAVILQGCSPVDILQAAIFGYRSANPDMAVMVDGGGLLSMIQVELIVAVSSSYAGIFEMTGILDGIYGYIEKAAAKVTPFGSMCGIAVLTAGIACNQTLATILTGQLCSGVVKDKQEMADDLENTVIVIAALVPWSIAGTIPLAAISAPTVSLAAACYLYLIPLWNLLMALKNRHMMKEGNKNGTSD